MNCRGGWVLEVDIQKFFDNLDHGHPREFLRIRVHDGVLLRLIDKWLSAGVMEEGSVYYPDTGTPQGPGRAFAQSACEGQMRRETPHIDIAYSTKPKSTILHS